MNYSIKLANKGKATAGRTLGLLAEMTVMEGEAVCQVSREESRNKTETVWKLLSTAVYYVRSCTHCTSQHTHTFSPPFFKKNIKQVGFQIQIFASAHLPHLLILSLSLQKQVQRETWSRSYFMLSIFLILWIRDFVSWYQNKLYCTILNW